uniref:SHOCT domain-containing protein n=2 Tax=Natrinema halophilum TaxID=1699371 RepID=A0A7D5KMY7_9EURY
MLSMPWYWALVAGMLISGIVDMAIKEVPPDPDEYDPDQYELWDIAFGESQNSYESSIEGSPTEDATPLETLRERYARGELTDEQFEKKVERLLETESLNTAEEREQARDILTQHSS